jgi:ribonuclease HI
LGPEGEGRAEESAYIGEATNNVAEYQALLSALKRAREMGADRVLVRTDSELLFRQIQGRYRVKSPNLIPLFQEVISSIKAFSEFQLERIPRNENKRADQLANLAVDVSLTNRKPQGPDQPQGSS